LANYFLIQDELVLAHLNLAAVEFHRDDPDQLEVEVVAAG
jgi:hypothetical protein